MEDADDDGDGPGIALLSHHFTCTSAGWRSADRVSHSGEKSR